MLTRRRFLQSVAAAAAAPAITPGCAAMRGTLGELLPDANRLIDLPQGFNYCIVSRVGERMSDGLYVPGAHDGMAAFEGRDGRVVLITNHELSTQWIVASAFNKSYATLPESLRSRFYDRGEDRSPCLGGTTTTIYDPASGQTERQFLSLGGTEVNCAGGKTPWGSWLSCEETFAGPGQLLSINGTPISREKRHGYVFEVPASATEMVEAVPLRDMGRFEHEAAAVHTATGVVYLTEDKWHSLFYRFLPNVPGQLHKGGRLQALAILGEAAKKTHNWEADDTRVEQNLATYWLDLDDVDSEQNDLRLRGAAAGAATFARGEGLCVAGDEIAFTCCIGGAARLGQVFSYKPSPFEGDPRELDAPGRLKLIAESDRHSLLTNCDNLTMSPWGDLLVCEDTVDSPEHCALVGMRPDGGQYLVANNVYSDSELAGACFSPDGKILFLNIQVPGTTIAISGPWPGSVV